MNMRMRIFLLLIILISFNGFANAKSTTEKFYLGYGEPPEGSGCLITYVINDQIVPEWGHLWELQGGRQICCFSLTEYFGSDFYLGDRDTDVYYVECGWPSQGIYFNSIDKFSIQKDYPRHILWWTGDSDRILTVEPKLNRETYSELGQEYLDNVLGRNDFEVSPENIKCIYRVDLNSDGVEEVIYGFESDSIIADNPDWRNTLKRIYPSQINEPFYSVLLLRFINEKDVVQTISICEDIMEAEDIPDISEVASYGGMMPAPAQYALIGIIDLDGDRVYEIITYGRYWEAESFDVWHFTGNSIDEAGGWSWGV